MKIRKGISRHANLQTLIIFLCLFTIIFTGCGGSGGSDGTTVDNDDPSLTEKEIQDALDMDVVDRKPVLHSTLGAPDTFLKVADELQGQIIVSEEWSYLELGIRIDMVDGEIGSVSAIESLPDDVTLYPRFYDPDEFTLPMDRDEVLKILDGQEYSEFDLSEADIDGCSMIIGDQIILGFADDQLVYVETFAHVPDPEDELSQLYIDEILDAAEVTATFQDDQESFISPLQDIYDYRTERASGIESLLPPKARLVVSFFRLLRARNQRNQVYREARNVQKEYGEYLDRLYDKATEMAGTCKLKTSDRQRTIATLNKIRARIDEERQALNDFTEGEKKAARSRFIIRARGQIIEALRTSGIGTRVLERIKDTANLDETLSDLQKVVDGVLDPGGFKQSLSLRLEKLEILSQVIGGPVGKDFRNFISQAQKSIPGLGELQDAAEDLQSMLNKTKAEIEKVEAAMAQDKNIISPAILLGNLSDMGKENLSDPVIDTLSKALSEAMGPKYARNLLVASGVLDPKQFGTMYERFRGTLLQEQTKLLQQLPKSVCGRPAGQDMRETIDEDPSGDEVPFSGKIQSNLPLYRLFEAQEAPDEYGSPAGPDGEPLPICKSLPIDFDSLHDEVMKALKDENYIDFSLLDLCRSDDDVDGDGYIDTAAGGDDCNDSKAFINPAAVEVCDDGIDNDCSGYADCQDIACTNNPLCANQDKVWRLVETVVLRESYENTRENICLGEGRDGEIIQLSGESISAHFYSTNEYCGLHFDINGSIIFDSPPDTVSPGEQVVLSSSGTQSGYQDCCSLILWFNYYTDAGTLDVSPEYVQLNLNTLPITQVTYPDNGLTYDGWQGSVTGQAATTFTFPDAYVNDFWCSGRGNRGVGYAWHYQIQE